MLTPEQQDGTTDIPLIDDADFLKLNDKQVFNYQDYGFFQAGRIGGTLPGLRVCLEKVYFMVQRAIMHDKDRQEELKKPVRVKIQEHEGNIERWEGRIHRIQHDEIPAVQANIQRLNEEKSHLRKHPEELMVDKSGKLNFWVNGIILSVLTVYLFLFYSSASYSAFFKKFTAANKNSLNVAIFDSRALQVSWDTSWSQFFLIFTIPGVFLGLGFLIHSYHTHSSRYRYLHVSAFVALTFVFDSLIAYEISKKIHDIDQMNKFSIMPEFSLSKALIDVNFWMIIFAGFVVYLIWGVLYKEFAKAFGQRNKLQVALSELDRQIKDFDIKKESLEVQILQLQHSVDDARTEIKKLNEVLNKDIIPREHEHDIYQFMAGWLAWMRGSGKNYQALTEAEYAVREFIQTHFVTEHYLKETA